MEKHNYNYTLAIVYINVILFAVCYQLQKPIEPYLIEKLSTTSSKEEVIQEYARLQSFFSIVQTIGSLIAGCVLDTISPRLGFLISFSASALGYGLVLNSTTTTMLFVSKIPSIFQAGYLCAQTFIAQTIGDSVERVRTLGRLAMCYTIGVIVGPALGGWLSSGGDLFASARVAVLLSLVAIALSACMPSSAPPVPTTSITLLTVSPLTIANGLSDKEVNSKTSQTTMSTKMNQIGGQVLSKLGSVLRLVWPLLLVKILISFANSVSDATRPIVLKNEFYFNHIHLGYFMSISSCVSAVSDGVLTGPLVIALGADLSRVQTSCIAILVCLYIAQAILTSASFGLFWEKISYYSTLISYVSTYFMILVFRHILSSTMTGLTTGCVRADEKGTLLGLENALYAAARVLGPLVGVQLFSIGRASLVALGSAAVLGACHLLWNRLKWSSTPSQTPQSALIENDDEEPAEVDDREGNMSSEKTKNLRL